LETLGERERKVNLLMNTAYSMTNLTFETEASEFEAKPPGF
jgi:hypothetical protein